MKENGKTKTCFITFETTSSLAREMASDHMRTARRNRTGCQTGIITSTAKRYIEQTEHKWSVRLELYQHADHNNPRLDHLLTPSLHPSISLFLTHSIYLPPSLSPSPSPFSLSLSLLFPVPFTLSSFAHHCSVNCAKARHAACDGLHEINNDRAGSEFNARS